MCAIVWKDTGNKHIRYIIAVGLLGYHMAYAPSLTYV